MTRITVNGLTINATKNHPLQRFQKEFHWYDKILSNLAPLITGNIIDIGANIGDTTIAIHQANPNLHIYAIEPDPEFYPILTSNIPLATNPKNITPIKAFINNQNTNNVITKNKENHTGHMTTANGPTGTQTLTYPQLLKHINQTNITLIKIDTDGYDHQILSTIHQHYSINHEDLPIIFFEFQTYDNTQGPKQPNRHHKEQEYLKTVEDLLNIGYDHITIFDNFGIPIITTNDINHLASIVKYTRLAQTIGNWNPAFYHDILLHPPQHQQALTQALKNHVPQP